MTFELLTFNPDHYHAWNLRKQLLKDSSIDSELKFNVLCIKKNPKSYSAWYHRRWLLQNLHYADKSYDFSNTDPVLEAELVLLNRLFDLDSRNCIQHCLLPLVHAWNYRMWLTDLAISKSSQCRQQGIVEVEWRHCIRRIEANFSNNSAWHHLARLYTQYPSEAIPLILPGEFSKLAFYKIEAKRVLAAIWTDPTDESPWWYWRWLVQMPIDDVAAKEKILADARMQLAELELVEPENKFLAAMKTCLHPE